MKENQIIATLLLVVALAGVTIQANNLITNAASRTFTVDYANDQFLMDGRPFKYVSGSFHYFRALPETWRTKLRTMRAAGLNAVSTYVEWSLHNPHDGEYNFDGIANLEKFIEDAREEDLYVILRPGPYICAEREMGGLPYWLLHKYPGIKLRTNDTNYLSEVEKWFDVLMPKMKPYLYGNGGPIIMVQVENEYGSFRACDHTYGVWLRDEMEQHVENAALLFTTDGPGMLNCGKIDKVFATIDFGASSSTTSYWAKLREVQPGGPLVNSEYYPGWLTHWQEDLQRVSTTPITNTLRHMLAANVSVNFYMFFGGTNFGFTAGANDGGPGFFNADITSYDYDAPMDEAGDPTPKYMAIRDVIKDYFPLPNISVPIRAPKSQYGTVQLRALCNILSETARRHIGNPPVIARKPKSFEQLNQFSGFVLYETRLPQLKRDPVILEVKELRDRALIYNDNEFVGILSRENVIDKLPMSVNGNGKTLQILVENQGRINYNIADDYKGILGTVKLGNRKLTNWTMTGYPLHNYEKISLLVQKLLNEIGESDTPPATPNNGPVLFYGEFEIQNDDSIYDTYLDPTNWGKGIAFVNGFNLGRYWPAVGPQVRLYVPKELLKKGTNVLVVLENQFAPHATNMVFSAEPKLDL